MNRSGQQILTKPPEHDVIVIFTGQLSGLAKDLAWPNINFMQRIALFYSFREHMAYNYISFAKIVRQVVNETQLSNWTMKHSYQTDY